MPEGDTVHKGATVIRKCLLGQRLREVQLRGIFQPQQFAAAPVEAVEAVGKHLLITAGDLTLRVHLGMHGAWSRYAAGSARRGEVVLATEAEVLVCRQPKDVELFRTRDRKRHPALSALGPDLLGPEPDYGLILSRARARGERPLGEVLLDQRVAAGLGNVYKSELAFLGPGEPFYRPGRGLDSWAPLASLDDPTVIGLYRRGREALLANLGGWVRTTTIDRRLQRLPRGMPPVWVYGRAGQPCLRCGTPVRSRPQGEEARVTCWCPRCQA